MISSFTDAFIETILAAMISFGIYLVFRHYRERRWLQRYGLQTVGTVVRIEAVTEFAETTYYPIIKFYLAEGTVLEARYEIGTTPSSYKRGESVIIFYDPDQPARFVIGDEYRQGWTWLLAVGLVGGILAYALH